MTKATFSNGHALIIGVGFDLPVTVKDATALDNVLVDPNRAAYPQHQIQLLTEDKTTRQGILEAFDRLIAQVNKNPDATVIVYFSGHGGCIKDLNGVSEYFLVTHDYAQTRQADKAISGIEFTKKIEAIKSRKLVVLLDCCHAAGMPALKDANETFIKSPLPPTLLQALDAGRGRVVVASSREDEKSYTGNPYSVFTTCLLEALAGKAARNQDGFARILDVLTYLIEQVPQRTSGLQYQFGIQHPFVNNVSNLDENFALCYYAGGSKYVPTIETESYPIEKPTIPQTPMHETIKYKKRQETEEEIQHLSNIKEKLFKRKRKIELDLYNVNSPVLKDEYENYLDSCLVEMKKIEENINQLQKQMDKFNEIN